MMRYVDRLISVRTGNVKKEMKLISPNRTVLLLWLVKSGSSQISSNLYIKNLTGKKENSSNIENIANKGHSLVFFLISSI